jgi:hypothetical protein
MRDWFSQVYEAFIVSCIVAFIIAFFTEGQTSLGAYIAGYSILILALMMILLVLFNRIMGSPSNDTSFQILIRLIMTSSPFLIMLGIVIFLFYLIIVYQKRIIEKTISSSYFSFNNIAIILLFIQLYMVYKILLDNQFQITGKMSRLNSSLLLLLSTLIFICSTIIYIILKYYTTDGFSTLKI